MSRNVVGKMSVVRARIIGLLIAIVVATACAFPQDAGTPAPAVPRILIELPDNIPSDAVWIRYILRGPGSSGAIVKREPNLRRYVIDASIGVKPAQHAKIVVYAPGCRFKAYTIDLDAPSDVSEHFRCDSLPSKTVHGFLPPAQIPTSIIFPAEKTLVISGELEPDWVCDFFLQPMGGSCLGAGISLGRIGDLDPANGSAFEITIPDFTRDPVFHSTGDVPWLGNFGVIVLVLRDQKIGRIVGGIKPVNAGPESGLNIENEYPNPVNFYDVTMRAANIVSGNPKRAPKKSQAAH
jgi:hypothetical protein